MRLRRPCRLLLALLSSVSTVSVVACGGNLVTGGGGDDADSGAPTGDAATTSDGRAADSGSLPRPPECANPGPFSDSQPTAAEIGTGILGTWVYCETSIFVGAEALDAALPNDGVGIVFRPDEGWQELGVTAGKLVALKPLSSSGTWSVYTGQGGAGIPTLELDRYGGEGVGASPSFSGDGRSVSITTSAGGHTAILAKAVGTE